MSAISKTQIRAAVLPSNLNGSLWFAFLRNHSMHPEIWIEFARLTLSLIANGRTHYGAKAIMEVVRFNTSIRGSGEFKVNNNHTAFYARVWCLTYPEYETFFETRDRALDAA